MIIDKQIKIKVSNKGVNFYNKRGYKDISIGDIILVNINDLSEYSHELINVKCDNCDNTKIIRYCDYMKVFNKKNKYYCSKCKSESIKIGVKNKYGVDNIFQSEDIKNKIKKTNLEKYGVEYYLQSNDVKEKTKETNLEKYGAVHHSKSPEIKEKTKVTNLQKYGVKYSFNNIDIRNKIKETNLEKYGVYYPLQNNEIIDKALLTKSIKLIDKYDKYKIKKIKNTQYTIHCNDCGCDFEIDSQNFRNRIKYNTILCTKCNIIGSYTTSGFEIELQKFIQNNTKNTILFGDRKIIHPLELDIYIPELKIAFEFNGLWWHNELYKDNNYHLNKTELCDSKGIQLINIWEDDWIYKQDIVKSIILNKLNNTTIKIFARKCEIKEIIDNKVTRYFLNNNHIQGFVGSKIKIGLYYNNELVSLMTFGKRRIAMGKKLTNDNDYELLRFCNKLNTNVVGGASRLFKYFIRKYNPQEITTYADRSHSQGKLYNTLNFKFISKTEPNYYYVIGNTKNYRFNYRKDILVKQGFDPNKTEHEIMLERKIYRIYDSGNLKYIYKMN